LIKKSDSGHMKSSQVHPKAGESKLSINEEYSPKMEPAAVILADKKEDASFTNINLKAKPVRERLYYLDWVRAFAVHLVCLVHTMESCFEALEIKKYDHPDMTGYKNGIVKCLVQVGIPIFFYISGTASIFYKCEERGFARYMWAKVIRLILPFLLAIPFLLIPRLYFGQAFEKWTRPDDGIEENIFVYLVEILPGIVMKLSWLWFLPVLFVTSGLGYPLLAWT